MMAMSVSEFNAYIGSYPPRIGPPMSSLTLTLYCTMIPRFSRWEGSAILKVFFYVGIILVIISRLSTNKTTIKSKPLHTIRKQFKYDYR